MPFEKGNKWAKDKGRPGYEFEEEQKLAMRGILYSYFSLLEKVKNGKATEKELIAIEALKPAAIKTMDKYHANRNDITAKVTLGFSLKDLFDQTNADKQ